MTPHPRPDPPSSSSLGRKHRWVLFGLTAVAIGALAVEVAVPVKAADDTLQESQGRLRQFPFQPNCAGNTQEMVACLWQVRNQADASLLRLLGDPDLLEQWRASRRKVCARSADKALGGSVHPIVWLSCENSLNKELLRQISRPLLRSADL